jgi:hypothetical protein
MRYLLEFPTVLWIHPNRPGALFDGATPMGDRVEAALLATVLPDERDGSARLRASVAGAAQ